MVFIRSGAGGESGTGGRVEKERESWASRRLLNAEARAHVAWGYLYQNVFYINTLVF